MVTIQYLMLIFTRDEKSKINDSTWTEWFYSTVIKISKLKLVIRKGIALELSTKCRQSTLILKSSEAKYGKIILWIGQHKKEPG